MLALLVSNSVRIINNTIDEHTSLQREIVNPLLETTLSTHLFSRDFATLTQILRKLKKSHSNNFTYIAVMDKQGKLYVKVGDYPSGSVKPKKESSTNEASHIFYGKTDLSLSGEKIGEVHYGMSNELFFTSKKALAKQGILIAVAEIILTALLLGLTGYLLTRNLYRLISGMQYVTQGQYDTDIKINSKDEIGRLATGFNKMSHAIRSRIDALTDEKERIQITFESIADAVITTNIQGQIDFINPAAEKIIKCCNSDVIGLPLASILKLQDESNKQSINLLELCKFQNNIQIKDENLILTNQNEEKHYIQLSASSISDHRQHNIGFLIAFHDISELVLKNRELQQHRNNLEALVATRTNDLKATNSELRAANKELESFSYSVSHDLRAPLRSIDGFSHILLEDYADKLDDDFTNHLQRIRNAAGRMGDIIDDLLLLARTIREELKPDTIDLSKISHSVIESLRHNLSGRDINFIIENNVMAYADKRLMRTVLENLFENACKYTGKVAHATITFGTINQDNEQIIFIKDNGAGFDMAAATKIFDPFQRLHKSSDFQGTGIGLATVQRIIHRHGGRIWVESKPDDGATFFFTIQPISQQ